MVMDATQPQQPSPQSVGREFVRQYYTLLNKAPNHLHRFYNNNSSFIHGELNLVVGQKNIHNRIQQLNFHDCHAKISQVDAQATLGNGVVVQVTGELSNDGQPMRRFTQTFVLAAQSPKKYYVHNDIFRYQDMYSDEENDGETRSEHEEELDSQQQAAVANAVAPGGGDQQQQVDVSTATGVQGQIPGQVVNTAAGLMQQPPQGAAQPTIYYSMPVAGNRVTVLAAQPAGAVPMPAQFAAGAQPVQAQLNGVVAHEELLTAGNPGMQAATAPLVAQATSPVLPVAAAVQPAQPQVGVATVPVPAPANVMVPQSAAAAPLPGFQQQPQQSPNMLQQQQQQLLPVQLQNHPSNLQQQPQANQQQQQQNVLPSNIAASNNNADTEDVNAGSAAMDNANSRSIGGQEQSPINNSNNSVAAAANTAPIVDDFKTINEQQQQEKYEAAKQQQQQQNEPKTYANLFKSTSSSPSGFINAAMQQQQQLQQQQQQQTSNANAYGSAVSSSISSTTFSQQSNSTSSMSNYNNRGSNTNNVAGNEGMRMDNNNGSSGAAGMGSAPLPQRTNAKPSYNKDFERRPSNTQQFLDNQQLFLGNIPHHATEDELAKVFAPFGIILELRILSKPYIGVGVRNPLNYGFITYSDAESVQRCLKNLPLYFPDNSPDGQKLNVEEKKPRQQRPNDMVPRQPMGSNMGNNMNNSQRNMSGGPPSRSLSNSGVGGGGMMRSNNPNSNNKQRGGSAGGPRLGGGFNRNDNRSGPGSNGNGPQGVRGSSNNNAQSGGGSYVPRR